MFIWDPIERALHGEAEERAKKLLWSWLTGQQIRDLEEYGYFFVRGSDTGERYRISASAAPFNVAQLDDDDKIVMRFCVVPQGLTTSGDIVLAQKIWFETDELLARARANRSTWTFA